MNILKASLCKIELLLNSLVVHLKPDKCGRTFYTKLLRNFHACVREKGEWHFVSIPVSVDLIHAVANAYPDHLDLFFHISASLYQPEKIVDLGCRSLAMRAIKAIDLDDQNLSFDLLYLKISGPGKAQVTFLLLTNRHRKLEYRDSLIVGRFRF